MIAIPVTCYLHKGVIRHFMDDASTQAFTVLWPDVDLPPAQNMSAGPQTEISPREVHSRSINLEEHSEDTLYSLPKIRPALSDEDVRCLIQALSQPEHEFQAMYPLESVATHLIEKIVGTPMFEQFRTDALMQTLKRERNGYARALSVSHQGKEAAHLFKQLIHELPVSQAQQLATDVFQSLKGISPVQLNHLVRGDTDAVMASRILFSGMQKQAPMRTISFQDKLEANTRPQLSQLIQVLSEGIKHGEIHERAAQQILVDKFPEFGRINPVDLSDILHQAWQFRSHAQRTECLSQVLDGAANFSPIENRPLAQQIERSPQQETVPGRPQLRPR